MSAKILVELGELGGYLGQDQGLYGCAGRASSTFIAVDFADGAIGEPSDFFRCHSGFRTFLGLGKVMVADGFFACAIQQSVHLQPSA